MANVRIELIDRPGCHLCDDVRAVIAQVLPEFPHAVVTEIDVDSDDALRAEFTNDIPVIRINGVVHSRWCTTTADLRAALTNAKDLA